MLLSRAMGNTHDIRSELRQIEHELIELELRARGPTVVNHTRALLHEVRSVVDHARALLAEVRRIERVASRRSDD